MPSHGDFKKICQLFSIIVRIIDKKQNTEFRRQKNAEIRKSGYQEGGYQNIRKSDLKSRVNRCKSVSDTMLVEKTKPISGGQKWV